MNRKAVWALFAAVVLAALGPVGYQVWKGHVPASTAADFRLSDAKGNSVSLSAQRGKVVLLDFWATNCAACRVEAPWLSRFAKAYAHRGLLVIGVALDEQWPIVRRYMAKNEIPYPVVLGTDTIADAYKIEFMPTTFLIDREGKVVRRDVGLFNEREFEGKLTELLDAK